MHLPRPLSLALLGAYLAAPLVPAAAAPDAAPSLLRSFKRLALSDQFWCEGASFADFNQDGKNDVAAGPWWWEGPDFIERREIYPPTTTFQLALGELTKVTVPGFEGGLGKQNTYSDNFFSFPRDFNGDGFPDLLIVGFPGQFTSWFENPKSPAQPWTKHPIFPHTDNESPTFTDLTGDGKPELVCITGGAYGYASPDWSQPAKPWDWHPISPNKGYGNFTHGLGVGDVNGDGRADLLEKDGWYEQPPTLAGDPLWEHHPVSFAQAGGAQMFAYDVNGDGRNDVITSLAAHGFGLAWHEQDAQGNFKPHLIIGQKPEENPYGVKFSELHALSLADINGDGLQDIVTGKRFWSHGRIGDPDRNDEAVLYWFELQREPRVEYIPHRIDNNSGVGTQLVTGDINGDHLPDIVVGNKKGIFVLLQETKPATPAEIEAARPQPTPPQ